MNNAVIYSYKGSEISFMSGESTMINATQMAKSFDKRPIDYLRLPSTNELINAILRKSHIAENQLVITERGGLNPGTWFHEDVIKHTTLYLIFLQLLIIVHIFAVRNFLIKNVMGIFYAHKAYILKYIEKLYPCLIDHMAIREFRRLGYGFSFFINNK